MCYAERFWNPGAQRFQSVWGCLDDLPVSVVPREALCRINSTEKLYFCCNDTDFCNDVTLRLPDEMPVAVTESVSPSFVSPSTSPSASPSASTMGEGGEERNERMWEEREMERGTRGREGPVDRNSVALIYFYNM